MEYPRQQKEVENKNTCLRIKNQSKPKQINELHLSVLNVSLFYLENIPIYTVYWILLETSILGRI